MYTNTLCAFKHIIIEKTKKSSRFVPLKKTSTRQTLITGLTVVPKGKMQIKASWYKRTHRRKVFLIPEVTYFLLGPRFALTTFFWAGFALASSAQPEGSGVFWASTVSWFWSEEATEVLHPPSLSFWSSGFIAPSIILPPFFFPGDRKIK